MTNERMSVWYKQAYLQLHHRGVEWSYIFSSFLRIFARQKKTVLYGTHSLHIASSNDDGLIRRGLYPRVFTKINLKNL